MGKSKIVSVRISRWSQFFELALRMKYREWYFRGQEDARWPLRTVLERVVDATRNGVFGNNGVLADGDTERRAVEYFARIADSELRIGADALEVLSVMQHYGAKTRLLDFTFSIFKALYFAFENLVQETERAIFAVSRIELATNSPTINSKLQEKFTADVFGGMDDIEESGREWQDYYERFRNDELFQLGLFKEIVDAHMAGVDHFERDVIPVVLEHVNPRMRAQDGLFLLPLTFDSFNKNLAEVFKNDDVNIDDCKTWREENVAQVISDLSNIGMVKMVFDGGLAVSSQQVLAQANVFPHTVYPDLVGMAKSARCWCT